MQSAPKKLMMDSQTCSTTRMKNPLNYSSQCSLMRNVSQKLAQNGPSIKNKSLRNKVIQCYKSQTNISLSKLDSPRSGTKSLKTDFKSPPVPPKMRKRDSCQYKFQVRKLCNQVKTCNEILSSIIRLPQTASEQYVSTVVRDVKRRMQTNSKENLHNEDAGKTIASLQTHVKELETLIEEKVLKHASV